MHGEGDVGTAFAPVVVALFGLAIGSFVNVVIARLPEHQSLWHPGSSCPGCGAPIGWRDNVPVLSFVLLRARCRACGMRISWRYPVVEVGTAALWVLAYARFGAVPNLAVALVFLTALVAITGIDLEHQIIPDRITLPGIVAGLVASLASGSPGWLDSLIGIAVGGGLFFAIIVVTRGGMGGGDMKLGAMFGAFLGWKVTLVALFVAVVLGGVIAMTLLLSGRMRRKDPIPFGPFLALGGAVGLLWGPSIVEWYMSAFVP
jgi:leader peptidase (prepilin peptidase) / N-methyltransferase